MHSFILPTELVADALEYLAEAPDKLWIAARVSRQFYTAAWRAGLLIHRTLYLDPFESDVSDLAAFRDILEHAGRKSLRLSLAVASLIPAYALEYHNLKLSDYTFPGAPEILTLITAALPLLVILSIQLPDCFRVQLDEALSCAAPLLRILDLHCLPSDGPRIMPLPSTLFAGFAPQLRTLVLTNVAFPEEQASSFRSVLRARFIYEHIFPPVAFGRHLPQLRTLRVEYRASDEDAPTPDSFDLSALALRRLIVDDSCFTDLLESVERSVDLSTIPHVLIIGDSVKWNDKVWTEDCSPLSIRVSPCCSEYTEVAITVTPAHRRWQRILRQRELGYGEPLPIGGMPNIDARMTYLRIDSNLVRSFLQLGLELPTLRKIHIDIDFGHCDLGRLAPPEYSSHTDVPSFHAANCTLAFAPRVWAPCPGLDHVTLFALNQPFWGSDVLDSRRIAFVARALGQLERPAADRAVLALIGIRFTDPVAHTLLAEVVSEIRMRPFCGRGSREDYDGGLWEHEFSEADRG